MSEKEVFKLGGVTTLALLASLAVDGKEAKAEPNVPGGQEIHDLLLCACDSGDKPVETIVTDSKSPDYSSYPSSWDDPEKILSGGAPRFWKGYFFKPFSNYVAGTLEWHIFKMANGEESEVGQLPEGIFAPYMDIISLKSGLVTGTNGKYYRFVDTGSTVNLEELGDIPQWGALGNSYGGYIFNEHPDLNNQHKSYVSILNEDDILNSVPGLEVPLASEIELQTDGTNKESGGLDVDEQTGELVVALQYGFVTAQLPPLDADGKLPADFSLTELTFSQNSQKTNLGKSTIDTFANQGYKYFKASNAKSIFAVAPDAQKYELTSAQLCGNSGTTIAKMLKLETGGIYIIFDDDFNLPPISLVPTSDPMKFIAPGVPFEKIVDEPTNVTQHIIDDGCTVIPAEYHSEFEPAPDPCADVTCPPPAEQCKTAVCDQATGDCVDTNKIDGTTCDADANACTVGDSCADGQCAPGAPKTCAQPAEQCEQSAGCDANTGNCLVIDKTNGTLCNDGDPDTENDKCASGVCEGTPVVKPEPDGDDAEQEDVIEGELVEEVEPDEDVVEAYPEGGDSDVANPDTVEPDMTSPEPDADVAGQEIGQETDTSADNTTPPEVEEDQGGNETEGEAQEEDVPPEDDSTPVVEEETPGKTPGCSCDVSDAQRQQRGVKEMIEMFGMAALAVLGLRRKKEKNQ